MPGSTHSADSDVPALDFSNFEFNVIDGQKVKPKSTRHGTNPATAKALPEVPVSTQEDVDTAMNAARKAFKTWSKTPISERRAAITAFANALGQHKEEFAQMLTQEQGKPIEQARSEADTGVMWLTELSKIPFEHDLVEDSDTQQVITRYTPLGVGVGIVPWNFPILLMCGKVGPALVTGNTLIIKPSPFTPYCNLKLGELAQSFFPPGVLQVLSGDDNLGPWLTEHEGPDKISFTGSSYTGKLVMASAAKTLKRVTLELGGNDPCVVMPDADVESVAPSVAALSFMNSGQICIAIKRVYVHESIYDKFKEAFVNYAKTLKIGSGADEQTTLGPIQNSMQYEKVKTFFDDIDKEKWNVAYGGKNEKSDGYFISPTVIDNPPENSRIVTDEPFGPIVPLLKWSNEEDVVARANDTKMGLGASVWGTDIGKARKIAEQLESGSVWINNHIGISPIVPFGGHKHSGIGHEWGPSGLKSWCNVQALFVKK